MCAHYTALRARQRKTTKARVTDPEIRVSRETCEGPGVLNKAAVTASQTCGGADEVMDEVSFSPCPTHFGRSLAHHTPCMRPCASRVYLSLQLSRRWKLVVFSCAMLSNAISVANVFPYAPLMVEHLGMTHDRRELGFYAGFLMASYMIGSILTQYHLGMLCDRWGRKKVILLGLASGTLPHDVAGALRTVMTGASVTEAIAKCAEALEATERARQALVGEA